ncbi:MAG TPA: asparagine synthase (glutamine-hydrolyzing), partial [Ignavibacteriaceae bacterium]|nr:asparagine synthase (glutamine-hydrolyzing) [Ignavibacteriaceae bacterium]
RSLVEAGHKFYTLSDTEVILHLYEDEKENCLLKLNGQFAFAVWDSTNKELFISRDRVGKKPLFYTINGNQFFFSSEIKALFTNKQISREIDYTSLSQIFTFWTTLPGRTIFKDIKELAAGSYLKYKNNKLTVTKYWDYDFALQDKLVEYSTDDIVSKLKELLIDAVRIRLRADVQVGSYLSGGLDSSGITALIKKNFNNELSTFGIRFEEESFDEGEYQSAMVSNLNVDHTEIFASNKKIGELLPDVMWHCEIPLLRLSPVPLFMLSKLVNQNGFRVVLTGEGADEVFGGYNIFKETLIRSFWAKYPDSELRPRLLERLYPYIFKDAASKANLKSFFKLGIDNPNDLLFSHMVRWQNTSRIKRFFSDDIANEIKNYEPYSDLKEILPEKYSKWDALSKAQYLEMKIFLSNYLLSSQGDRVAMAHSVEIRMPYLDYRIIEFMSLVPSYLKIRGLNEKSILKKIFKDILPDTIRQRVKHPYRAPIKNSLLNNNLDYVEEYLSEKSINKYGLFNSSMVKKLKEKLTKSNSASEIDSMALVGILTTQILSDMFGDNFQYRLNKPITFDRIYDRRSISMSEELLYTEKNK